MGLQIRDTFACVKLVPRENNVEKKVTRSWEFLKIDVRFTFVLVCYLLLWIFYFDTSRDPLHFYHYYYNYYYFVFCLFPPPIFVVGICCMVGWLICHLKAKGLFTWRCGTPGRWGNLPSRGRKIKRVHIESYNPGVLRWGFLSLLLCLQLGSFSIGYPSLRLEKDERFILDTYIFIHESVSRCVTWCWVTWGTTDLIHIKK